MTSGPDRGDATGGGVLGNLPRSRPGQRSEKRAEPEPSGAAGARERSPRRGTREREARGEGDPRPAPASRAFPVPALGGDEGGGPLGGAARVAGRAARRGLGAAGGVLRRLPRP